MLVSAHGYLLVLMSAHEWSIAAMSTHKHSYAAMKNMNMAPTALMSANKHSWAWCHGASSTHSALAPYSLILMSAQERLWVVMSASEESWMILNVQILDSVIYKKKC